MAVRWKQPQLPFQGLGFLPRKRKIVKTKGETFKTGRVRRGLAGAPLGIERLASIGSHRKITRKRKAG